MKKINLISSFCGVAFLTAACGSSPGGSNGSKVAFKTASQLTDKSSSRVGGSVEGPCILTGDIRSFQIDCSKRIRHYGFVQQNIALFFAPDEKLILNDKINGVPYDMNIEVQGTKMVGSEKLASKIDLTIIFSDSSKCSASLWVAD